MTHHMITARLSVLLTGDRFDGRYGDHHRAGGWVVALLLIAATALITWFIARRRAGGSSSRPTTNAEAIVAERFARGEISADDYRTTLGALRQK